MAEGRMLRRSIAIDTRVAQLSVNAQLLYVRCIPFLDRDGRIDGLPARLRGLVVPLLPWSDGDVERYMDEWQRTVDEDEHPRPLVVRYCVGGVWACAFTGFAKNQRIRYEREAASQLPAPTLDLLSSIPALQQRPPERGTTPAAGGESLFERGRVGGIVGASLAAAKGTDPRPIRVTEEGPDADSGLDADSSVNGPDADSGRRGPALLRTPAGPKARSLKQEKDPPDQRRGPGAPDPGLPDRSHDHVRVLVPRRPAPSAVCVKPLLELLPPQAVAANTEAVLADALSGLPAHYVELTAEQFLCAPDEVRRPAAYMVSIAQRMARDHARPDLAVGA